MIIRRERQSDRASSRAVQVAAFASGDDEPPEARLLDELRVSDAWIAALSWVAESDGQIVGHNVATRAHVGDMPCVALGPIAVAPSMQGRGVGSGLVHSLIGAADASGEPLIALLGNPNYYSRFGFVRSTDCAIRPPNPAWHEHFQVLPLSGWTQSLAGTFRYSEPFDRVS
ncbi:MAG: N-acetyltransferase [Actinomycetota bacterium]